MAPKTYHYRGGVTSAVPLTGRQLDQRLRLVKAKASSKVQLQAIYSADGTLVGLVDPADITPVASPAAPAGNVQAQAKKVSAQMNPPAPAASESADQAATDVAKAVFGATFRDDGASTRFTKAAGTTNDRWTSLIKSIDQQHGTELQRQVASAALRFVADGMSSANAVALSKRLGVQLASSEQARQARLGTVRR